jgi:transcriptional regulator with XRE-family HTH domain
MSFDATFSDLRRRRRIPMSLFEERVGINRSYIHSIEKEGLLPSLEKLEALASVFVEVAREQRAADPEEDERLLVSERERVLFVDRLGLGPEMAAPLLALAALDETERSDLTTPIAEVLDYMRTLVPQERRAVTALIARTIGIIGGLPPEKRGWAAVKLVGAIETSLAAIAAGELDLPVAEEGDPLADPGRRLQTSS